MTRHIDKDTADKWSKCADLWRTASTALADIELILLLEFSHTDGKAIDAVNKAIDAVSGQAYMFTPQPEWIGGDSADPKNHKTRLPHIARQ